MKQTKIFSRASEATIAVVAFEAPDLLSGEEFVAALRSACSGWVEDCRIEGTWVKDFNVGDLHSECDSNGWPPDELALRLGRNGITGLEIQIFQADSFIDYDTVLQQ